MSGSHTMSENIVSSELYELVSDVKDEVVNCSDDEREISVGGPHEDQGQHEGDTNSALGLEEFNPGISQVETPSVDDQIDIKYEVNDIQHNLTHNTEDDLDLDIINPLLLKCVSINSEEKELNGLYSDLLLCERECGTCQEYIRKLREHVRCAHATAQSTCDPLHIDPLEMGQSSFIEVKCEEDKVKVIESMECSEETESDPDFDGDGECGSESESDPDYDTSPHMTRKANRRNVGKENELEFPNEGTSKLPNIQAQFTCNTCGQGFVSKYRLTKHEWTHTGETPYTCQTCGDGFVSKYRLVQHERTHNGGKTPMIPRRRNHKIRTHTNTDASTTTHKQGNSSANTRYKCAYCGKGVRTRSHLIRHMRSHTGERPLDCTVCGKCFSYKSRLEVHMVYHTGVKLFKCEQCAKSFSRKDYLTRHMRSHTGEQPFNCETCSKDFRRKDEWTAHMRYHTGEDSLKCYECEVCFTQSSHLSRHKKNVHKHVEQIQN